MNGVSVMPVPIQHETAFAKSVRSTHDRDRFRVGNCPLDQHNQRAGLLAEIK